MSRDLKQLLHDTAAEPTRQVEPDTIVTRARRRTWTARVTAAVVGIVTLAGVTFSAQQIFDTAQPPEIIDQPTTDPQLTASDTRSPTPTSSLEGPVAADLPGTVIASVPGLVELDPVTGEVIRQLDAPVGEGTVHLSVTPDGRDVYHEELWTGCATRIHRTSLNGGESELLGPGMLPTISPDGNKLAYVSFEPCVNDNQALVVRDLASGDEQTRPLRQPVSHLARISGLSWSADSQQIALELSYTLAADDNVGAPVHYTTGIVDTTFPPSPIGGREEDGHFDTQETEYRHPTFRGDTGALLAVAYCCYQPSDHPGQPAWTIEQNASQIRLVERDPSTGLVGDTIIETHSPITDVAADPDGDGILFVESQPKEPGVHAQRDVLKLWSNGQVHTIAENVSKADWRPTP